MILWFWVLIALNQTFDVIVSVLHWTRRRSRWRRGPSPLQVSVLFTSRRYLSVLAVPCLLPLLSVCLAAVKMQTGHVWFLILLWAYFEHAPQQFTFLHEFLACVSSLIGDGHFFVMVLLCYNSDALAPQTNEQLRQLWPSKIAHCYVACALGHTLKIIWCGLCNTFWNMEQAAKDLPCWCWEGTFYRRAALGEPTIKLAALENVLDSCTPLFERTVLGLSSADCSDWALLFQNVLKLP